MSISGHHTVAYLGGAALGGTPPFCLNTKILNKNRFSTGLAYRAPHIPSRIKGPTSKGREESGRKERGVRKEREGKGRANPLLRMKILATALLTIGLYKMHL